MRPLNHTASFKMLKHFIHVICLLNMVYYATAQQIELKRLKPPGSVSGFGGGGGGTEDPRGYIWFGSDNGLYRYDGYQFITYLNDPLDSNSLANNRVERICAGKDGMIWLGTAAGLDRLDPVTGKFTHFPHNPADDSTITENKITALLQDKNGMVWIGTGSGLNLLDTLTKKVSRFIHRENDSTSLSDNDVGIIYEDRSGTIWIGTGDAFTFDREHSGGLNRYIPQTRSFKHYLHDPRNINSLIDNRVKAIFEDSRGVFWVGTSGDGLHTLDREKGVFERHLYDPRNPDKLSRPPLKTTFSWAPDQITFITEDAAGYIWIGTLGNGLVRYDYTTNKVLHVPDEKEDLNAQKDLIIKRDHSWWAMSTSDGVLWIGYWSGIYQYDPLRSNIPFFETGTSVTSIYRDSTTIWIGGLGSGLIKKDLASGTLHFFYDPLNPKSEIGDIVSDIKQLLGSLWITTDRELIKLNPQSGSFSKYRFSAESPDEFRDIYPKIIIQDKKENIWFATLDKGLIRVDAHTGMLTRFLSNDHGHIKCLFEDSEGNIWVGYYLGGLCKLFPASGKIEDYLYEQDINDILQDASGIMWIGTQSGLFRSNAGLNSFSLFRDTYKEIPENIHVGGILEDNYKTLWFSTSIGILKLNPKRDKLIIRAKNESEVNRGFKAKDGQLYFGDWKGYFAFYPEELKSNPNPPRVVINEFRIDDVPVYINPDKPVRLKYDQNSFSFQFAGIHFTNPVQNRHLYKLEGIDNTWRKGGEDRTAYYNHVEPGNYAFHVKASNSDGLWSEKIIWVIVDPPWWRTWWAYSLYAVTAASLIWLFIYYGIKNLRNQLTQKQKEFQFEELRRQKVEIEMQALRAQMNPHFIFNSLNSINRFILDNHKNDASAYLSKFSRLVRLILVNSQAAAIPLQSELEALQLYLELEALRFNNHFNFKINIADEVDAGSLKVPPLIIQPFAENAIWHGLMPRKEIGNLEIDVFIDDQILICRIRDDGIGRKKAAELKSNSGINHKSFGMKITASRIELLKEEQVFNSSVVINDLVLPDNSAAGTEVVITLPVKYE